MGEDTPEGTSDAGEDDGIDWEALERAQQQTGEQPPASGEGGSTERGAGPADDTDQPRGGDTPSSDRLWHDSGADGDTSAGVDAAASREEPGGADRTPESGGGAADAEASWDAVTEGWSMDPEGDGDEGEPAQQEGDTGTGRSNAGASADTKRGATADSDSRFDKFVSDQQEPKRSVEGPEPSTTESDIGALFDDLDEFDRATSGSQVLVVSPRDHSITEDVCSHYLTAGNQASRNVLFVTTAQAPDDRLMICRDTEDWTGGRVGVIEFGDVGAGSGPTEDLEAIDGNPVTYKRVNSIKNFSKLGLLITQMLKQWAETPQSSVLCFHTLSTVSGYIEQETLFRFLFTLQAKLGSLGVTAHYHIDANAHDEQELATFKPIFDLVVDVDPNGGIEVD